MNNRFGHRLLLAVLVLVIGGLLWQYAPLLQSALISWRAEPRIVTPRGDLAQDEQSTIALFESARDSVVYITTAQRVIDPWTRNAYDVPTGTGSGLVWDELGHIVTNYHVIEGSGQAIVRLADGRALSAELVGSDPSNDLAVLRIEVAGGAPPPLPIGTSADLKVGQKVFAIGNPFGLDWTLTTGIVSALEREIPTAAGGAIRGLIQTDAAINPGNSGGPLVDSAGRLIGVNTAIFSPSGASAGIGFAVPVDTVNRVVPQVIEQGRYEPPSIGITIDPRADMLLQRAGKSGVLVLGVDPGSVADRVGLRPAQITPDGTLVPGDIITGLAGETIEDAEDLYSALEAHRPGERVTLTIDRDGEEEDIEVTLD